MYVACSRSQSEEGLAFRVPYTLNDGSKVGASPTFQAAKEEMERIQRSADGVYAAAEFGAILTWFIGEIQQRYGVGGVFSHVEDANAVLECMQQWRDSVANLS